MLSAAAVITSTSGIWFENCNEEVRDRSEDKARHINTSIVDNHPRLTAIISV